MATNPWEMDWSQASSGPVYGAPDPTMAFKQEDQEIQRRGEARAARSEERAQRSAERSDLEWQATHNPDGTPKPNIGPGTEGQGKAAGFLRRALSANDSYEAQRVGARSLVGQAFSETAPNVLNSLPGAIGNSPERQVADAAQDEFIAATLRYESGAAIPPAEIEAQRRRYFPMPGDGEEVLKAKADLRAQALEALRQSAGPAAEKVYQDFQSSAVRDEDGGLTGTVTDTSEAAPPAGAAPTPPAGPSGGGGIGEGLLQGVGSIVEGAASIPALVVDPVATTLGRALGYDNYTSDFASQVRNDLGLPRNQSETANNIIRGGVSALGGSVLGRAASTIASSQPVRNALSLFGATPGRDTLAGAGASALGEAGRAVGGVPGQVAGTIVGGLAGNSAGNALSRIGGTRTPNALMQSADELDVTMLPADVGGVATRMASGATGRTLGGIPMAEAADRSVASAGRARDRLASNIGDVSDDAGAGQAVRRGFTDFKSGSAKRANELYDNISVPPKAEVELTNTRTALADVTRGLQSNPELSKLWTNHPRLRESLEALTPKDGRQAAQVQYVSATDRVRGAEEALRRAEELSSRNFNFERGQARDALETANSAYDEAVNAARFDLSALEDSYDALRSQNVPTARLTEIRGKINDASAWYSALRSRDKTNSDVYKLLKPIDEAESAYNSMRFSEPKSPDVDNAKAALSSAKEAADKAFVASRQMPEGGKLSWEDMKRFRTIVGEIVDQPGISRDGSDIAALRKLYGALSTDMEQTAARAGPKALDEFRKANRYYRGREDRIDNVFQGLFGNRDQRSDEAVFRSINSWAQGRTGDFARLSKTIRSLPADEANTVRATVVQRMGMASPARGGAEVFSPVEFSTQWRGLSDRAKSVLFNNKQHRQDLDKFSRLTDGMKRAGEYQNFSNTSLGVNMTAQGALALTNLPVAIALGAGQFGMGKLLASPRFARIVASTGENVTPQNVRKLDQQLSVLATREPLLSGDIKSLQEHLRQAIQQSPGRAAAEEEADRRGEPPQQ